VTVRLRMKAPGRRGSLIVSFHAKRSAGTTMLDLGPSMSINSVSMCWKKKPCIWKL
jgi:hypothetical protein